MVLLAICVALALLSFVYALAGQAGGTAFLAVMALASFPSAEMRPTALILNIAAAGYATAMLYWSGKLDWRGLVSFLLPSLPFALVGGLVVLDRGPYFLVTGSLLLAASALMVLRRPAAADHETTSVPRWKAIFTGSGIGFLSGLTGIGGGVFLAPLVVVSGWSTPRGAALLAPPFILLNSAAALPGVLMAGQAADASTAYLVAAVLIGAAAGTAASLRWMNDAAIRLVISVIVALAGLRLIAAGF